MSVMNHLKAILTPLRKRAVMGLLSHRIRARHPSLDAHPTVIWDYGFRDLDALEIGRNVWIGPNVEILVYHRSPQSNVLGRLIIGDGAIIALGAEIRAAGGTIHIGEGSGVGQYNVLVAANHQMRSGEARFHTGWDEERCGVEIGKNVWTGAGCVILPGTVIGDNSVIAAGSVVRGTVPPGELWGGVPARKIKTIGSEQREG